MSKPISIPQAIKASCLSLLLALIASTAQSLEAEIPDGAKLASQFWGFDEQGRQFMQDVSIWIGENGNLEQIHGKKSKEIKDLIHRYYEFTGHLKQFSDSCQAVDQHKGSVQKFHLLYDDEVKPISDQQLMHKLMSTLADLLIFENLRFQYMVLESNPEFRKKLNELEVDGKTDHYSRLIKNWLNRGVRLRFSKSLDFLDEHELRLDQLEEEGDLYLKSLRERLETGIVEEIRNSATLWGRIQGHFKRYLAGFDVRHHKRLNWTEYFISQTFGNVAGSLNVQILLSSIPKEELARIRDDVLMPGDVIVEKTAGAITDKFIPGHFGHVAVYIGRPEQLTELSTSDGTPLLAHPLVQEYLPLLNEGATTVEAIRPGTRLEDIARWKITDLAILRPVSYPRMDLGDALVRALSYVGTVYDFNFDVNTEAIIVCSELPYQIFDGVNFRTHKQAGRWTISPDDVAVLAGPSGLNTQNRPFELKYFNHETKEVSEDQRFQLYQKLLEADSNYGDVPINNHNYEGL
jgi:uncharacterized protein YycO